MGIISSSVALWTQRYEAIFINAFDIIPAAVKEFKSAELKKYDNKTYNACVDLTATFERMKGHIEGLAHIGELSGKNKAEIDTNLQGHSVKVAEYLHINKFHE